MHKDFLSSLLFTLINFIALCKFQNGLAKSAAASLRCSSARGFLEESDDEINGKLSLKSKTRDNVIMTCISVINNLIPQSTGAAIFKRLVK